MARNDVRIKFKFKGVNQLMKSAPVQAKVNEEAYRLAAAAGEGHQVVHAGSKSASHRWVARAFVQQSWMKARQDPNALDLLRAIGKSSS